MRQFLDDASHELRTPLTSIRGFAELHRKQVDAPAASADRLVGRIESEANRMGGLLETCSCSPGSIRTGPSPPSPWTSFRRRRRGLRPPHSTRTVPSARRPGPRRHQPSPDDARRGRLGDEGRLRHLVTNLVDNALAHTPPARRSRSAWASTSGGWGGSRWPTTGPGCRADAGRVFERFYRTDAARSRKGPSGAGLGLSIVKAIALAHSGTAEVDSTPGEGTRFTLYLPLASPVRPDGPVAHLDGGA